MASNEVREAAEIKRLRKRLQNARKRAVYWSGRPSFTDKSYVPGRRGRKGSPDLEYDLAMSDMNSLADRIAGLCGMRPVVTDYREVARLAMLKVISRVPELLQKHRPRSEQNLNEATRT